MANKQLSIFEVYQSVKQPDRDERVIEKISTYFRNNIGSITDGIIRDIPKISAEQRDLIGREYGIGNYEWQQIQKSPEFYNMAKLGKPLNLGLIISYLETKNKIFLTYLFVLMYSSVYMKYMTKGSHNPMVMKYTIDTADNRTDFKRYECSLIAVVNKKVDAYVFNYKKGIDSKSPPTDKFIRELLQASKTRLNEMFKKLYGKYKNNLNNPDVKLMMEYSETPDGKHVLSMQNIFEKLKEVSSEALFSPSDITLNRVGLVYSNPDTAKYRSLIIKNFNFAFSALSNANSLIIDKWVIQNSNKLTLVEFKKTFIKTMLSGRNISHIYAKIDEGVDIMIAKDPNTTISYNKITARNYLYKYLVMNIYQSAAKLFK